MLKYIFSIAVGLFILMACNNSSNAISNVKTDSLVTLPFFNVPDWTPAWINKEDSGYTKIHSIPNFSFKFIEISFINYPVKDASPSV